MVFNRVFDVVSFTGTPGLRYLYIAFMSFLSAILFLLIFKKASNQEKIKAHKNKIFGNILQLRLYKDQFGLLIGSILNILKYNLLYIQQTLIPLVFMIIPLLIVMVQINNRCGYTPLDNEQEFIIRVDADRKADGAFTEVLDDIYCEPSQSVTLETPALRIADEGSVFWRASVVNSTDSALSSLRIGVRGNPDVVEKTITIDYHQKRFAPIKTTWSLWNELFNNAEGFIPADMPIKTISITYQRAGYSLVFWRVDAIILYFFLTLVFGFLLKDFFHVTI